MEQRSHAGVDSRYPAFISNRNPGQRSRIRTSAIQGDQSSLRKRNTAIGLTPLVSPRSRLIANVTRRIVVLFVFSLEIDRRSDQYLRARSRHRGLPCVEKSRLAAGIEPAKISLRNQSRCDACLHRCRTVGSDRVTANRSDRGTAGQAGNNGNMEFIPIQEHCTPTVLIRARYV